MLAEIGFITTLLAFAAALYAIVASVYGAHRRHDGLVLSARNAALLTFPLLLVAAGSLWAALLSGQYQMSYVWSVTNPSTPTLYRFTALWGSQKGSLLFWSLLMSLFAAGALLLNWRSQRRLMPYVTAYTMATLAFFLGLTLFLENPFERVWNVTGEEAARRGEDVILTGAGDDPQQLAEVVSSLTGLSTVEALGLLNSLPIRPTSCASTDAVTESVRLLQNAGGVVTVMPAEECTVQSVLIPANATAPSARRLAETSNGLNPLLRHFGMIIHPPMLYLGFVGFTIPFAFAMAALASGDLSTNWIKATRRWALVAWLFLGLGLLLGGRWAYDVLGWGGYWGWDPVENAAFLPWLVGTALIHSVMIQEKRGMLKVWNMFLVIGAFSAAIFGTFATRSGLVDSVHSFARSEIGYPMFFFWAAVTLVSLGLILWRWNRGELRGEHRFASLLSRESLFVLNNVIFMALFIAIFWGSFGAPIVSELFMDTNITLGTEYFMRVTPPLFLALYLLMGVAPLSAWGVTSLRRLGKALLTPLILALACVGLIRLAGTSDPTALVGYGAALLAGFVALYEMYRGAAARRHAQGESWPAALVALFGRNARRYGGYVVHLGITVIGLGVVGSTLFQMQTQQTLGVGDRMEFGGYQLEFTNFQEGLIAEDGRFMDLAEVTVSRNGQTLANLRPRRDSFINSDGTVTPMTIAGQYSTLENDYYVLLVSWEQMNVSRATFKIYINPLVNLVWWGGLILIVGTLIAAWPREVLPAHVRESALADGRAGAPA